MEGHTYNRLKSRTCSFACVAEHVTLLVALNSQLNSVWFAWCDMCRFVQFVMSAWLKWWRNHSRLSHPNILPTNAFNSNTTNALNHHFHYNMSSDTESNTSASSTQSELFNEALYEFKIERCAPGGNLTKHFHECVTHGLSIGDTTTLHIGGNQLSTILNDNPAAVALYNIQGQSIEVLTSKLVTF